MGGTGRLQMVSGCVAWHRGVLCGLAVLVCCASGPAAAGAACVMAKWQGTTLDYALVADGRHAADVQQAAREALYAKGYDHYGAGVDVTHPQAISGLAHGYAVVLRSDFKTQRGRDRTSFGCGFSAQSFEDATWEALRDMQRFSWGWKPDRDGYQVLDQRRF